MLQATDDDKKLFSDQEKCSTSFERCAPSSGRDGYQHSRKVWLIWCDLKSAGNSCWGINLMCLPRLCAETLITRSWLDHPEGVLRSGQGMDRGLPLGFPGGDWGEVLDGHSDALRCCTVSRGATESVAQTLPTAIHAPLAPRAWQPSL